MRERLAAAAAGALEPDELRRVEAHAAECDQCAAELQMLYATAAGLAALPMPKVPAGLSGRTKARVRARAGAAAEDRMSGAIVVFLVLFAWTLVLMPWIVGQMGGGSWMVIGWGLRNPVMWLGATTLLAWVTGGAVALVLLWPREREGRIG
jgi:anti-sigma factor RsiW